MEKKSTVFIECIIFLKLFNAIVEQGSEIQMGQKVYIQFPSIGSQRASLFFCARIVRTVGSLKNMKTLLCIFSFFFSC